LYQHTLGLNLSILLTFIKMSTLSALTTDVSSSEKNLFDNADAEMYLQQWQRQLLSFASCLAVSASRRQGLRDYVRTTAQLIALGIAAPMQPQVVPELPNNASGGAVPNHKILYEDANLQAHGLQTLIEFALSTGGIAFRAKHTNSVTGVLDVNMQQLCDDAAASYGIMLPRQLDLLENRCGTYDPTLTFEGNISTWTRNHDILRLNRAEINEVKKHSLLTTALPSRPEFRKHVEQFLYLEPRDRHTYPLLLAWARCMSLLFPPAVTATSFLAATVEIAADSAAVANATNTGPKTNEKRRKKPRTPAVPAAPAAPPAPLSASPLLSNLLKGCVETTYTLYMVFRIQQQKSEQNI
jgi:hypothetical protein